MNITEFFSKRTNLLIILFALAGILSPALMIALLNPHASLTTGPYEVQVIKAGCPEEMNKHYRILGKDAAFHSKTRIWYPSDPALKDLTTVIMFPATRIQYRGFRWMARQMASRGYVVTIYKHKMDPGWVTLVPGIRWIEPSGRSVQEKDVDMMSRFIRGLPGRHGQLAGRLALQRTGVVSRIGLSGTINHSGNEPVRELKNGIILATVEENTDRNFVISSEEFVSFDLPHRKQDRTTGLRSYLAKWMNLATTNMETIEFFPARMIINLLGAVRELNMKYYVNIQEELFTYFASGDTLYRLDDPIIKLNN